MLAEFQSVVDAVRCGVEIQRGMAVREPEVSEERRIRFRIGINLGDVIVEEHDIFGDGVNVAARLEAAVFGDPTLADAILDRIIHRAHRIDLKGPSLRRRLVAGESSAA